MHQTLAFRATVSLRKSNIRYRTDMQYKEYKLQVGEKHQAKW